MIRFIVKGEVPALKNILRRGKYGNFYHKNDEVKHYKNWFALQTPKEFKQCLTYEVKVTLLIIRSSRRKDCLNIADMIADCLQHAGVIKNDRQITELHFVGGVEKDAPRVLITVEPRE